MRRQSAGRSTTTQWTNSPRGQIGGHFTVRLVHVVRPRRGVVVAADQRKGLRALRRRRSMRGEDSGCGPKVACVAGSGRQNAYSPGIIAPSVKLELVSFMAGTSRLEEPTDRSCRRPAVCGAAASARRAMQNWSHGRRALAGKLLVATPDLIDPNFFRTVVLVVEHDDVEGTLGLVLNRPSGRRWRLPPGVGPSVARRHRACSWADR